VPVTRTHRVVSSSAALALLLGATRVWAWNPVAELRSRNSGAQVDVVEALQPGLAPALAGADAPPGPPASPLERVAGLLGLPSNDPAVLAFATEDHLLEKRLVGIDHGPDGSIMALRRDVAASLARGDELLRERAEPLAQLVDAALADADREVRARRDHLDEIEGRRLDTGDVLACQDRLALEETLLRLALLVGLVVWTVVVLRTLRREFSALAQRPWGWFRKRGEGAVRLVSTAVLRALVVAALAAAVLRLAYAWLPMGARHEIARLVERHQQALDRDIARFDVARARFHATQLERLDPDGAPRYQAAAAKTELIRDVLTRPALMATEDGLESITHRVDDIDALLQGAPDADVLTLECLVLWRVGAGRAAEHEAASLCARALRVAPKGFALAPLARSYVRDFLHAPYFPAGTGIGRSSERPDALRTLVERAPADEKSFPLAPVIALDRLLADLDRGTTAAYLELLDAQAEVVRLPAPSAGLVPALARRHRAAQKLLELWKAFEDEVDGSPGLATSPAALALFWLNDAIWVRARWYSDHADLASVAPLLHEVRDPETRAALVPPRVRWARRYRRLLEGPATDLIEYQEAVRFRDFEASTRWFERLYADDRSAGPKAPLSCATVLAAAHLGFYVDDEGRRVSLAEKLDRAERAVPLADACPADQLGAAVEERGLRFL
jgi:hypothetical protein